MEKKGKSKYKRHGLEFGNIDFQSPAERRFVVENMQRIIGKIRHLRKEKGLTQEAFAELTGVSLGMVKFIEQNQRAPSLAVLFKILFALDRNVILWE